MVEDTDGTPFGRYRLLDLLGRGGMGEVWRAYDSATERVVAVKVLPAHLSDDEMFQQRFRREAHSAARLNSPHVIPIHTYGEIDGRLYVDMRLIEGRDLQTVLADGAIEATRAVRIVEQVAVALQAAHEVGLVHRDVKPSNILLDKNDFAYLIDFGIARAVEDTRLTSTGGTIGTFAYIAPERLGEHPSDDARVDIYALACVLYECLTGQQPFPGSNVGSLVAAHLTTPPPQPSRTRSNVPRQIDPVIATGMAKDPDMRFATTIELAHAAREAITIPTSRPAPTQQSSSQIAPRPISPAASAVQQPRPLPSQPIPSTPALRRTHPQEYPNARDPGLNPQLTQVAASGQASPPPAVSSAPITRRMSRGTKIALVVSAVACTLVIAGVGLAARAGHRSVAPSTGSGASPTSSERTYTAQMVLPFTGLRSPAAVAADGAGNVYVTDFYTSKVLKLAPGSNSQDELPLSGILRPEGVAVDSAGNLYVSDGPHNRVLKLAGGSGPQIELPFTGLDDPVGVAVDSADSVYVVSYNQNRVVKLERGLGPQTELSFTGLDAPIGVAVDGAGNVYVTDYNHTRVLKLVGGSGPQTQVFSGLAGSDGVAVDTAGNVYATDQNNNRVLKLDGASGQQTVLPFTGLNHPHGVTVDSVGNVYCTDWNNSRVVKIPVK